MKRFLSLVIIFFSAFILVDVNAQTVEEMIDTKTVIIKSVPAVTEELRGTIGNDFNELYENYSIEIDEEDPTKGFLRETGYDGESYEVEIVYEYDEAIKEVADKLLKDLGDKPLLFYLNDIEAINYYILNSKYIEEHEEIQDMLPENNHWLDFSPFSGELKEKIQYNNFEIYVGCGMDTEAFWNEQGNLTFKYDGTLYAVGQHTNVVLPNVLYIDEDEEDVEKASQ